MNFKSTGIRSLESLAFGKSYLKWAAASPKLDSKGGKMLMLKVIRTISFTMPDARNITIENRSMRKEFSIFMKGAHTALVCECVLVHKHQIFDRKTQRHKFTVASKLGQRYCLIILLHRVTHTHSSLTALHAKQ